jgi:hypothetical protein
MNTPGHPGRPLAALFQSPFEPRRSQVPVKNVGYLVNNAASSFRGKWDNQYAQHTCAVISANRCGDISFLSTASRRAVFLASARFALLQLLAGVKRNSWPGMN